MFIEYDVIDDVSALPGCIPVRAHPTDAGADLRIVEGYILQPKEIWMAPTGIKIKVPTGYAGLIFSRSGFAKLGVTLANSVGVIDSDYRGEIKIPLINHSDIPCVLEEGTRVAQIVMVPCLLAEFTLSDLDETERGEGGFGHTGK